MLKARAISKAAVAMVKKIQLQRQIDEGLKLNPAQAGDMARRMSGIMGESLKVPKKEYRRLTDYSITSIEQTPEILRSGGVTRARFVYNKETGKKAIEYDPIFGHKGNVTHEFAHARQYAPLTQGESILSPSKQREVLSAKMFMELSKDAPYLTRPVEQHANTFQRIMEMARPEQYEDAYLATMNSLTKRLLRDPKAKKWLMDRGLKPRDLLIGALAASGVSLSTILPGQEAEAGIFSKAGKFIRKVITPKGPKKFVKPSHIRMHKMGDSTAAKRLTGQQYEGKVITGVERGEGDWRIIHFDDETSKVVKKKNIHDLARDTGTKRKISEFDSKDPGEKMGQALRSVKMRERTAVPREGIPELKERFNRHINRLEDFGGAQRGGQVLVERNGMYFSMPVEYAEYLEKMDQLKIVERLR